MDDEEEILQNLVDAIVTLKPHMNAFVMKYDGGSDVFSGVVIGGNKEFIKIGQKITGKGIKNVKFKGKALPFYKKCMKKNDVVVHRDRKEIEDIVIVIIGIPRAVAKLLIKAIGTKMAFTVPLSIIDSEGKRRPYGILGIASKRTDFSDFDLELIRILSVHSTQVLSNLELIKKLEKERNLSTTLLDIMTHDISNCIQMCYLVFSSMHDDNIPPSNEDLNATISMIESNIRILRNVKRLSVTKTSEADLIPIDLKQNLARAIKTIRTENPKRKLEIDLDIDDGIYIYADDLIQDIWLNIFRNTLKFDKSEKCSIGVGWDIKMKEKQAKVIVKITDQGPGIPDKEKDLVFGREHRGRTKTKGSGIGLFVVSTLMDYYQGDIWIENRVKGNYKKGSVFCLEFSTPQE